MPEFNSDELKNWSIEKLSIHGERYHKQSAEGILINNEIQRRQLPIEKWYNKPIGIVILGIVICLLFALISRIATYFYT